MLLQHLLLRPTPLISFILFKQKSLHNVPLQTTSLFTSRSPLPGPSSRLHPRCSLAALFSSEALTVEREDGDFGAEREEEEVVSATVAGVLVTNNNSSKHSLPNLNVKEKKELASYAHGLGKKLKSQQVGKSGVTDTLIVALDETLEANELLKLKIHNNCPGELDDVVKQLEEGTGSVVVGRIGRTVILYRPSLTKMKSEEKKKQALMVLKKTQATLKPLESRNQPTRQGQPPRQASRGRRGSSRFSE